MPLLAEGFLVLKAVKEEQPHTDQKEKARKDSLGESLLGMLSHSHCVE